MPPRVPHPAALRRGARGLSTTGGAPCCIGVLPGDGVGRELVPRAVEVVRALDRRAPITWLPLEAGFELFQRTGCALPAATLQALRSRCHGALFGAVRSGGPRAPTRPRRPASPSRR